jgi:carbon monoxide dehydrogenase subunit G
MKSLFRLLLAILIAMPFASQAHGPSRLKVEEEINVAAAPDKVWAIIADFCSIAEWHPGVYSCQGDGGNEVGATRLLTLGEEGGPTITEELQKYDAEKMTYKYKIMKVDVNVLPVTTYSSFISVHDDGNGGSIVRWRGGFYRGYPNNDPPPELNDEAAVKAVTGIYQGGLQNIKVLAEQ